MKISVFLRSSLQFVLLLLIGLLCGFPGIGDEGYEVQDYDESYEEGYSYSTEDYVDLEEIEDFVSSDEEIIHTNPDDPCDVNGDGLQTPLDALIIINAINTYGNGFPAPDQTPPYLDVDGDGLVTAQDALAVINSLNGNDCAASSSSSGPSSEDSGMITDFE